MKAALITRYGSPDVIRVAEVAKPIPGPGELLVKVHATSVNRTDCGELVGGIARLAYGLRRPRRQIFGMDVAGVIEQVGPGTTLFAPGERIFGMCPGRRNGAQAEYVCLPERAPISTLPPNIAFEEAPICEGPFYASALIKGVPIGPNTKLLVFGASGAIGSAAVQLAKERGAEVTAAIEPRHLELGHRLGADHVIDSTSARFSELGRSFDVVFDAVGKMPIRQWRRLKKPDGIFATTDVGPKAQNLFAWIGARIVRSPKIRIPVPTRASAVPFVAKLRDMLAEGRFHPVIDRTYPLDDIVDAYRYVQSGAKAGVVVVLPDGKAAARAN